MKEYRVDITFLLKGILEMSKLLSQKIDELMTHPKDAEGDLVFISKERYESNKIKIMNARTKKVATYEEYKESTRKAYEKGLIQ